MAAFVSPAQLSGTASDLCNQGGQKCGTPRILHSCLPSWAQVSKALAVGHEEGGAGHHWQLMFTTPPTPNG